MRLRNLIVPLLLGAIAGCQQPRVVSFHVHDASTKLPISDAVAQQEHVVSRSILSSWGGEYKSSDHQADSNGIVTDAVVSERDSWRVVSPGYFEAWLAYKHNTLYIISPWHPVTSHNLGEMLLGNTQFDFAKAKTVEISQDGSVQIPLYRTTE